MIYTLVGLLVHIVIALLDAANIITYPIRWRMWLYQYA